jgi:hypothetical protein
MVSFKAFRIFIFMVLCGTSAHVWAQAGGNSSSKPEQFGAFIGNTLPHGIPGADEIFPLWGVRYSHNMSKLAYAEFGGMFGHSKGVTWQGVFADLRMDIPIETLIAVTYIGLDMTRFSTETHPKSVNQGGGHAGGGLMSQIGSSSWVRFDMKLNSKPGTSLYFALGLVFDFDGFGGGGAGGAP